MPSSKDYWAKREADALKGYIKDEKAYDRELQRIYSNMLDACQKEIDSFYGKYARTENITIAEAKKRVSKADIAAFERKAARYVKDKDFSKKANEEMRLYNATMKINRLEMLKANIGLETIAGFDELEKYMGGILKGRTMEELERQAGILGKTVHNNATLAHSIVNASFHNATFSDRIWQYQEMMKADLSKLLQSGLIQGKNPRVLARELKKTFDVSTYNAERLMRTELARVQTDAQKRSFVWNGFGKYMFIVNSGCCDICEAAAKKNDGIYDVEKMMPGENAPPLHPHCRCSTAAYEDDAEYDAWLDYLDKGGTTAEWNATGKAEWQKQGGVLTNAGKSDIIQSKYGFKRISGDHSADDDIKVSNPNYKKGQNYQINCQRCVPTYEMRRRGYDVEALPYGTKKDKAFTQWQKIFNDAKWDSSVASNRGAKTQQNIIDKMAEYGDGARAEIYCVWKGASSAHVFAAENIGGKVRFIDPQTGNTNCDWYFKEMMPSRAMMCRIDNLEPSDLIADCCKNKG